jgi:Peptidase family S41
MRRVVLPGLFLLAIAIPCARAQEPAPDFEGTWVAENGHRVLQVRGDHVVASLQSPLGLLVDESAADRGLVLRLVPGSSDPDVAEVDECSLFTSRFRRLARMPDSFRQAVPTDPRSCFDAMAWVVRSECPCLASRGLDWDAIVESLRAGLSDTSKDSELFEAMRRALDAINDIHFGLSGSGDLFWHEMGSKGRTLRSDDELASMRRVADRYAMTRFERRCNGLLQFGRLANLVGYIRIDSFMHDGAGIDVSGRGDAKETERARKFVQQLDESIRELDFVESLVLDLRFNHGGYAETVVDLASRFVKPGQPLLTVVRRDTSDDPAHVVTGPVLAAGLADHPRYLRKLIVLTSRDTCSAGEILPLALLGRDPPAIRIGEATAGAFCRVPYLRLPNGWTLAYTDTAYRSPKGESFEGSGLAPDFEVEVSIGSGKTDAALEKALALVGER